MSQPFIPFLLQELLVSRIPNQHFLLILHIQGGAQKNKGFFIIKNRLSNKIERTRQKVGNFSAYNELSFI